MLSHLTIKNFGLIDELAVDFDGRLTVLTGETGAGKSIIIDALRYALGERLDPSQVRSKDAPCAVEAVLHLDGALAEDPLFAEYLTSADPALIISRSYLPDGKTRIKVNGAAVTVATLKSLGDRLVDFHGPNDHQMLLDRSSHRVMLDHLAGLDAAMERYRELFDAYDSLRRELAAVRESAATRDRELDLLSHQLRELERYPLDEESFERSREDRKRLDNAERLYEAVSASIAALSDEESGAGERIAAAFGPMRTLTATDPSAGEFAAQLESLQGSHAALVSGLERYRDGLAFEPGEAAAIRERAERYDDIVRKYGPTIDDAAAFCQQARERRDYLADSEHNDAALSKELLAAEKALAAAADKMTRERKKAGQALTATIERELKELGIAKVRFEARVERAEAYGRHGRDEVTFYISPNAGEELKPLSSIVSSGEAARVMLALKKALIAVDPIPTLIFDEIDAQIGGRLGTVTGMKVRELAAARQVILITHLPQIASFADLHYQITKKVEKGRTATAIAALDKEARVTELAQMMAGREQTAVARAHAAEMLAKASRG